MIIPLHNVPRIKFIGVMLYMIIVLMKGDTNKYLKRSTVEAVAVGIMMEECTKIVQYSRDVGITFFVCLV